MRTVSVLGSTGSIGRSTVDLLGQFPGRYAVAALVGGRNAATLAEQAVALRARRAVLADEAALPELRERLAGTGIAVAAGREAVCEAAAEPVDWCMAAIIGAAGLEPTLAAIRNGRTVALANKEAIICAGEVMLRAVRDAGATLLPVDSEHNAIFQAMAGAAVRGGVERITLTASGGPFRDSSLAEMERAGPEAALKHPVWSMGAKISIDSATMFNKGLEVIEAARLFELPEDRIDVLVHPQSTVHGMVHYADGSILAQLGAPDMRIPIAHALGWPERLGTTSPRLDLAALARLDFAAPDPDRFPSLELARAALRAGGAASAVLSAANEVAVEHFLGRRIGFRDIARLVEAVTAELGAPPANSIDAVLAADAEARRRAEAWVAGRERRGSGADGAPDAAREAARDAVPDATMVAADGATPQVIRAA
ncbi:MAG: 1-deoxy-D-xylulose-5-phosphate reductoisomerase [Gluconacetobacter diazotrophicus]|nr:1-deoxy-D-xylulose-5-phosphate reductoisomerase [Gluconacetobacter diazotrophicus]